MRALKRIHYFLTNLAQHPDIRTLNFRDVTQRNIAVMHQYIFIYLNINRLTAHLFLHHQHGTCHILCLFSCTIITKEPNYQYNDDHGKQTQSVCLLFHLITSFFHLPLVCQFFLKIFFSFLLK